mgnify:FL=1|jgi:hypothetical protein|tara:strand:+ start:77 stop:286 length:210 start_codon:yes stop_codon:yes gene_type:complete
MSYYTARVQWVSVVDTPKGQKEKKVTESYLVDAMSVTEAEAKVVKDFEGYTFDFEVKGVTQSKIVKIID